MLIIVQGRLRITTCGTCLANQAYQAAHNEARQMNHEYLSTEHLLLGLLRNHNTATVILRRLAVDVKELEEKARFGLSTGEPMVSMGRLPRTPRLKAAIDYASDLALREWHHEIDCAHMLAGLAADRESIAGVHLICEGVTVDAVQNEHELLRVSST